jgi:hypothetical protein
MAYKGNDNRDVCRPKLYGPASLGGNATPAGRDSYQQTCQYPCTHTHYPTHAGPLWLSHPQTP